LCGNTLLSIKHPTFRTVSHFQDDCTRSGFDNLKGMNNEKKSVLPEASKKIRITQFPADGVCCGLRRYGSAER
jgi:hypothetical protein